MANSDVLRVVDADPSQMAAIHAAEAGSSFVLQSPPGTGISQIIANIIGQLLGRGRSVRFVSQKLAALEVVKSRLQWVGLGPFCLELHTNQASKLAVAAQLRDALEVFRQHRGPSWADHALPLQQSRQDLNQYALLLDDPSPFAGSTRRVLACLLAFAEVPRLDLPASTWRHGPAYRSRKARQLLPKSAITWARRATSTCTPGDTSARAIGNRPGSGRCKQM